jgi:hypothetical protein
MTYAADDAIGKRTVAVASNAPFLHPALVNQASAPTPILFAGRESVLT